MTFRPWEQERKGYRREDEPPDARPVLSRRHPFWKDASEALHFMDVAERHPKKPGESNFAYIVRLAGIAKGESGAK